MRYEISQKEATAISRNHDITSLGHENTYFIG
jgi:hypothetical protein